MWQRSSRGRGRGRNQGPWPGNGPFSHLPPWERPGWLYGPGSCWYFYQRDTASVPQPPSTVPLRPAPSISFCPKCNASLVPFAKYCSQCGAKTGN